jgi:predicted small lipoprotein YifL
MQTTLQWLAVGIVLTALEGCGGKTARTSTEPLPPAAAVDEAASQCRQVAYDRVRNLPSIRSGRATTTQEGPRPYYESCMVDRGFASYPPF